MSTSRTLQPEDQLAHYRVVGPLGAGGMGEVYLAQDQTLERNVALKVLPQELVRSEERVRRFVQEAKSASSLNHPNIITIYEIGQDNVRPASGEVSTGSVQYISMELVSGKTLGAKIHEEKTELRTLLGYLAQAAEGIAKAHAAGIVHRDLKPGNIMVSEDGFAKVLDFGLAKLTEQRSGDASATAMTEVGDHTAEGAVLGTVHYMSPEQVQGKSVDHRSDIFSFGCLLYEAATRRRPFVAESNVETMHKILHDKPQPIEEINPAAPAELRRLVRRCLHKSPDQRLQSMKDLAIELREIVDEYDSLSLSATSATTGSGSVQALPGRRTRVWPLIVGALVIAAAGITYGVWSSRKGGEPALQPFQNMRAATQTSRGDVTSGAISPDGRYLAYVAGAAGQSTLRVRQVATGSDVEVLPVQDATFEAPAFTPDGNYLFYLKRSRERPLYRSLMRVPSLGGPEEERGFDVDSRVAFSPDGKRVCFVRGIPQESRSVIMMRDLDAGTEKEFVNVDQPEAIVGSPSWSPDGKRIAAFTIVQSPKLQATLAMFDAETGKRDDFLVKVNAVFTSVAWIPDGRGLITAGTVVNEGIRSQIFMMTYPGGQLRRVTNDFDVYNEVSVAGGDEGAIAALRVSEIANIYAADPVTGTARRLTSATSPERSPFTFDVEGNRLLFPEMNDRRLFISVLSMDGGEPRRLNPGPGHATVVMARGDVVVFQRYDEDAQQHVWRINIDGTGLKQVTTGGGENLIDVSPDGKTVAFSRADSTRGVWSVPTDGGEMKPIALEAVASQGAFSQDGQRVVVAELHQDASGFVETIVRILSASDGTEISRSMLPNNAVNPKEGPGGLSYLDRNDPVRNVFTLVAGDDKPKAITKFTGVRLTDHIWSPDFKRLAVVVHDAAGENVWVVDANGGNRKQLTSFGNEDVFQVKWTNDGKQVVARAGRQSRDMVKITNFR